MLMTQTMRWFGPADPVSLAGIRQAGATEVVTALHEIPNGAVWPRALIAERRAMIEAAGLGWTVVESLPVHEDLKTGGPRWDELVENYRQSLTNLAAEGVKVVTYNFMPLLDWTRTDLAWRLPDGALALRFELDALAAFDLFILRRPDAERDYDVGTLERAAVHYVSLSRDERERLERTIIAGLPGAEETFTAGAFLQAIQRYDGVDAEQARANHIAFLKAVCPTADALGLRLAVHPDDPPSRSSACRALSAPRPTSTR